MSDRGSDLFYWQSKDDVRLGDVVLVRLWFRLWRQYRGVVAYIPGFSPPHRDLGDDQWAIKLDDGMGVVMGYSPHYGQPSRTLRLVSRGPAPLEPFLEEEGDEDEGDGE